MTQESSDLVMLACLIGPVVAAFAVFWCVIIYRYVRLRIAIRDARRHAARVKYSYAVMDRVMPGFTAEYDRRAKDAFRRGDG